MHSLRERVALTLAMNVGDILCLSPTINGDKSATKWSYSVNEISFYYNREELNLVGTWSTFCVSGIAE